MAMFSREQLVAGQGKFYTQSLFYEFPNTKESAIFTMKDRDIVRDGKKYLSLKKIYLEIEDITEYDFAIKVFGNYRQWVFICNNKAFTDMIEEWRDELALKLRARAVRTMIDLADKGNKDAAKWISDKKWMSTRGRPTKAEINKRLKEETDIGHMYEEDFSRLAETIN